ncbi:hypothetical protein [Amycolatopsis nigrescens]|uniref:hypothetical protein n=1 Tax=Amycolatopsis nigrescens TaxID=381445 RepID=UPI00036CA6D9|nr:hypothetical protein [Amycolatopsis nigrescens]
MVEEGAEPPVELVEEFVRVAHRIVWCTLATVDRRRRPRARVVHPYWERRDGSLIGWVLTRPTPLKRAHLAGSPFASCSYWDPAHEVAVAECEAAFAGDELTRRRVWDLFANAPAPLGYDPKMLGAADPLDEAITVLELVPWRLHVAVPGGTAATWRRG